MKRKRKLAVLLVFAINIGLILLPGVASAELSPTPTENTWVTDGEVRAIVSANGITYIGGDFTHVGPNTGHGVPIDATTGSPALTFPRVNGTVEASVPDGFGGFYIGGTFTRVGGVPRNRLARILSDGTVCPTWNPDANGTVRALVVSGTTVYVGGWFTAIGGLTRNRLAAIDATGMATTWNPNANSGVDALAVSGTTVYVGGWFTTIGAQSPQPVRNRIAAIDITTGNATPWNPNAGGGVLALAVSGTTIYAGGGFTTIGAQSPQPTRNRIAAIDITTGNATAWNPNANSLVLALAVSGTTVYAGGVFTSIGAQAPQPVRNRIAAIEIATGNATPWNPNANEGVRALVVSGTTVYAGGWFTSIGAQAPQPVRNRIAAIDITTGNATPWNPNANNPVYSLAVSGTTVYAGGDFTTIGAQVPQPVRNRIAAIEIATGNATAWNPNASSSVRALAVSGTTVYAGGRFTSIGGGVTPKICPVRYTHNTTTYSYSSR